MPQESYEPVPMTIDYCAFNTPEKIAIVDCETRRSYLDLNNRVNRLLNALLAKGIKKGDRVAVLLHNRAEYIETIFALNKLKAGLVPIGYRLKGAEIEYILNNSGAKAIIIGEEFVETLHPLLGKLEALTPEGVFVVSDTPPHGYSSYESLLVEGTEDPIQYDPTEIAPSIIYTSGTTGRPKGAFRGPGPRDISWMIDVITQFGFGTDDTHIVSCPLYHSAPPFFTYVHLVFGATAVIMRKFDPVEYLATIEREKVTTAFVVPTQLNRIAALPNEIKKKYDVSSMKSLITGAAPCHYRTKMATIELFGEHCLFEFYGSTETGINTILSPEDQLRKIGSCGKVISGNEIRLLDESGKEVRTGEVGELWARNSVIADGYHRDEKATKEAIHEGFFTVGDMARLDEDGYYYIVDRKKDMVISGGVNIYPAEIEIVLRAHPKVYDAAVIGVPDPEWGESLKALVVLRQGETLTEPEVIDFCSENLADYKKPRSVEFLDEIPHNPAGKPMKKVLREKYWKEAGRKI